MIRKLTLLFLLLCCGVLQSKAQYCGSDKAEQRLMASDPAYAQKMQQLTNSWVNWLSAHQGNPNALLVSNGVKRTFQIPVVIHVITPGNVAVGTTYNPTDAQLTSMIDYLNQTYNGTWGAYPDSANGGVSIPVQFVLAQRDSNCNPTTGIERVDGSGVAHYSAAGIDNGSGMGAQEIDIKNLARWPGNEYYNIWIVNRIDSMDGTEIGVPFTAGYAYLPPAPSTLDGIIILATQATPGVITIPHEMGHALSLLHTFQGGTTTTCPVNNNCATDGDQICDTQPEKQSNFNCPVDPDPCTGGSYDFVQHNFMDYSDCQDRFTAGQRDRMIMGLLTYRGNLIGSMGGVAPGGATAATACTPSIAHPTGNAGVYEVKIADNTAGPYIGNLPYVYLDYSSSGFAGDGNKAYIDLTCHQQATLTAGSTYKFFVKEGPTPTGERVGIYIDYNNDGVFSNSELVYTSNNTSGNAMDSAAITLPTYATMPTLVTCTPIRMRVVSDRTTTLDPCSLQYGQAEDYNIIINGNSASTGSVTIAQEANTDTTCVNTPITFRATPSAGLDSATTTYQWFVNGTPTGTTIDSFTSSTLLNNDVVTAKIYYINGCGVHDSALSNSIIVHRVTTLMPHVSIAVTGGSNPGCQQSAVTFTATGVNGGTAPTYLWYVNGAVMGAGATFTDANLNNGDSVSCVMTSSSPCAAPLTATSNKIGIVRYYVTDSLYITVNANPSCAGGYTIFTSHVANGQPGTLYQWYIDDVPVAGATDSVFISTTIQNTNIIKCIITSTSPCVVNKNDTSNQIIMTINPVVNNSATDSIVSGANPGCLDSLITFGATTSGYGAIPAITWMVNDVPSGSGYTFSSSTLQNGDQVVLQVIGTDQCYLHDTLYTNPINMQLAFTPDPPIVSLIGDMLVTNVNGYILWYGPNGLIANEHGQSIHPPTMGNYYAIVSDTACESAPSNVINVSLLSVGNYSTSNVKVYPNPATNKLILDWGTAVNAKVIIYNVAGQAMLYNEVNNQARQTIDISGLAAGSYYVVLKDESGHTGTVPVTVLK